MTDFESRLRGALDQGAGRMTAGADLADGARSRAARRRRRHVRMTAVAAVAVLAAAVPVGISILGRSDTGTPVVARGAEWRTLELVSESYVRGEEPTLVLVDVPVDWVGLPTSDCVPWPRYGPPDVGRCSQAETLATFGTSTFDGKFGPGLRPAEDFGGTGVESAWFGYVDLANLVVSVSSDDAGTALQVLGSVRPEGADPVDVSGGWGREETLGISYWTTPSLADEGVVVDVTVRGDGPDRPVAEARRDGQGAWTASVTVGEDRLVRVSAPTEALTELIAGSARPVG